MKKINNDTKVTLNNLSEITELLCKYYEKNMLTPSYETYINFVNEKTDNFFDVLNKINVGMPNKVIRVSQIIPEI